MNAWSLLYDILNGTFDEEYPIVDNKETEHSDYYYDYTRNDPNAKNPFTDPKDRERAEKVVNGDPELDRIERMGGFEWTPGSPWPPVDPEEDGLDYEDDLMIDNHYVTYDDGMSLQVKEKPMAKTDHNFKYHEDEILKDIQEYVSRTYQGHYTGTKHEFRKVQTIDLMAARDIATGFCQANILKYGSRYGSKDGKNKTDLLKVIHYAMLLLHFDGHYGEPSMPSGNFDQMP
jgi:hypothetical protein